MGSTVVLGGPREGPGVGGGGAWVGIGVGAGAGAMDWFWCCAVGASGASLTTPLFASRSTSGMGGPCGREVDEEVAVVAVADDRYCQMVGGAGLTGGPRSLCLTRRSYANCALVGRCSSTRTSIRWTQFSHMTSICWCVRVFGVGVWVKCLGECACLSLGEVFSDGVAWVPWLLDEGAHCGCFPRKFRGDGEGGGEGGAALSVGGCAVGGALM